MNAKNPEMIPTKDSLLVAISYSGRKEDGVLIVGRKKEEQLMLLMPFREKKASSFTKSL